MRSPSYIQSRRASIDVASLSSVAKHSDQQRSSTSEAHQWQRLKRGSSTESKAFPVRGELPPFSMEIDKPLHQIRVSGPVNVNRDEREDSPIRSINSPNVPPHSTRRRSSSRHRIPTKKNDPKTADSVRKSRKKDGTTTELSLPATNLRRHSAPEVVIQTETLNNRSFLGRLTQDSLVQDSEVTGKNNQCDLESSGSLSKNKIYQHPKKKQRKRRPNSLRVQKRDSITAVDQVSRSDLASLGLDEDDLDLVLNLDLAGSEDDEDPLAYLRTCRYLRMPGYTEVELGPEQVFSKE